MNQITDFITQLLVVAALFLLVAAGSTVRASEPPGGAEASPVAAAGGLASRLDVMDAVLAKMKHGGGESARAAIARRHWQLMQEYMDANLQLLRQGAAQAAPSGALNCRVVGDRWPGLSYPGHLATATYEADMQALSRQMRSEVTRMQASRDGAVLQSLVQAHWDHNYQYLQKMRGLGWMFDKWMPAQPVDGPLMSLASKSGQLADVFCTQCHARPSPNLHTAIEWDAVMATMNRHMQLSDGGPPICVTVPSDAELESIGRYLRGDSR